MIKSYVIIAFRNLRRQKGYAVINIAGLAVGIAVFLLISLFIRHELSYDRFHENAERIYRPVMSYGIGGSPLIPAYAAQQIGAFPEVERFVRMHPRSEVVLYEGEAIREEHFFYADASFFDIFSFTLVHGNPRNALAEPNTVVLSESTSEQYFGERVPIGETLTLQDGTSLRVTGVAVDTPSNSHLQFALMASFRTLGDPEHWPRYERGFGGQSRTYLLLSKGSTASSLQQKLDDITDRESSEITARLGFSVEGMYFDLQRLSDIHLKTALSGAIQPEGDVRYIYIFGAVAFFILLIAAINYMNLTTARSIQRAHEVGVRKVLGARRTQVAGQFLSEAVLVSLLAFGLALLLVQLLLTASEFLFGPALDLSGLNDPSLATFLAGLAIITGIISGSYPGLVLSRFAPASVLKYGGGDRGSVGRLRKGLVTFQFTVSIALIIGTLVVQAQLNYMQSEPLGYDAEQVLTLPIPGANPDQLSNALYAAERDETLKNEFLRIPGVQRVSIASGLPIQFWKFSMDHDESKVEVASLAVDPDYLETMGMELVAGRNFSNEIASDTDDGVIVNQTAARLFELEDKIDQQLDLDLGRPNPTLIGIVSDFHTGSLHKPIRPVVLSMAPEFYNAFVLRVSERRLSAVMASVKETWQRFAPDQPFEARFADDVLQALYEAERRLARTFRFFAGLAIFISCLGLFGLAAIAAERRTKEIGIRKVMGATVSGLLALLTKDFVRPVLFAFVIAVPIAYLAMNRWLQDFAYRIEIGPGAFLVAGGLAFAVALLASSYHAVRATVADPVDSLRHE